MPIPLRRGTAADAGAIKQLVDAAYVRWVPVLGRKPLPMMADYTTAAEANRINIRETHGRLVALIEMRQEEDRLMIVNVAVALDYQGEGLGRALMAHAESVVLSLDLPETRLYTNMSMVANIALYQNLGYRKDHEEPFMRGIIVRLSKRISKPSLRAEDEATQV